MAKDVKALWKKYSDGGAYDGNPPTKGDAKLRDKHVSDSIPYNFGHAKDHLEEIVNQAGKLKVTNPQLADKLTRKAAKELHGIEQKINTFGGSHAS